MVLENYITIVVLLTVACALGLGLYAASYIAAFQRGDTEKVSPYECGFDPFADARHRFQVKFYLVAILFLIFDLEVSYVFPWALTLREQGALGYWSMMLFLLILPAGFVYEWKKGALEWE